MKKQYLLLFYLCCMAVLHLQAQTTKVFHVWAAPGTLADKSITLLWNKLYSKDSNVYQIILNGKWVASTRITNYTLENLQPSQAYTVVIRLKNKAIKTTNFVFKTAPKSKRINILDFGAKADSTVLNTKAIQAAINACAAGGTVYIPKGVFLSGALFLKSNMTLHIDKEATLKGSKQVEDYMPMLFNRFEGWEMNTYASLINAGRLARSQYVDSNIRITGGGKIFGGGKALGDAMIKANGMRSRGRLICMMSCKNISIDHLTLQDPPCWNLHYIYSHQVTCSDLTIVNNVRNGDGIDPDSSTDSYIFNCSFDTGDDCIAIKSGKNPEGYYVGKPTSNVQITHCNFIRGHGISIGSEMSGGVRDVLVQDCEAGNLLNGMQIKGTKERGGYVKNVEVSDCSLMKITVFSALNYNNDGAAAPEAPIFENFVFKNINMLKANPNSTVMILNGFKETRHALNQVKLTNITLPEGSKIVVNNASNMQFEQVLTQQQQKPTFEVNNSTNIVY